MNRFAFLGWLGCAFLPLSLLALPETPHQPNFVFILADDLGYGDLGCYGAPDIETPHLDRLAAEGLRFTGAYANGAVCTPTRLAFLTGRFHQRTGIDNALYYQEHGRGIPAGSDTIASLLRDAGYATGLSGKWHLGYDEERRPRAQGFDHFFGLLGGNHHYFAHMDRIGVHDLWLGNEPVHRDGYTTDLVTTDAIRFVETHRERPFFLFVSHPAPHFPWQGPGDGAKTVKPKTKSWQLGDRPTYAAMVESMDDGIGRLVARIDALGLGNRTLIVFTSDNGGHTWSRNSPFRGAKASLWEGGIRVPAIARWNKTIPPGTETPDTVVTMDWTATFLALAGVEPAQGFLDGVDLTPVLTRQGQVVDRTLFWRRRPGPVRKTVPVEHAVRQGKWKYLARPAENFVALYDLEADPGETTNRLDTSTGGQAVDEANAMARSLREQWERWERSIEADASTHR